MKEKPNGKSRLFQMTVMVTGLGLWVAALVYLVRGYPWLAQLVLLSLVPLVIVVSRFLNTLRLPSGLRFKHERMSLTLADVIVLLVAYWYGLPASVFIAGIDGFCSSRRTTRLLPSNLFSSGIMSFAAAAASLSLCMVLRYGWTMTGAQQHHSFPLVALALLVASIVHAAVNMGLLSVLLALRHGNSIIQTCRENLLWTVPMFLSNTAAASSMQLALRYDHLATIIIGGPLLLAIYFWHRHYRLSIQEQLSIKEKSHRETIEALAVAINAKDQVTHEHVLRVQIYAAGVARLLGCTGEEIEALKAGALLHDIGKIAVPDYILNKPGKLTAAEFEKMKVHTLVGAQILGRVEFPYPIVPVVRHHHERWDGHGYPDALKAEEIPLTARILSVVDCFDAVREDRQYRKGMTRDEAINYIMEGSGTRYDPRVVGTFITHLPEFEAEILALRDAPLPSFGIEPGEELSEHARHVAPAAGLAEEVQAVQQEEKKLTSQDMNTLAQLSHLVEAERDIEEILNVFTENLQTVVPYDSCAVILTDPENFETVVAHAVGQHAALLKGRIIAPGEGVTGWVLAHRRPYCNTDPKLDLPPTIAERFAAYRTMAVFPLLEGKENYGAIALYSSSLAEYDAEHRKLLEASCLILAAALSNAPQFGFTRMASSIGGSDSIIFTPVSTSLN